MASRKKFRSSDSGEDYTETESHDEVSDGDEGEDEEVRFSQPGSIKRLKFVNFMQYTEVEFQCGPNLNVIIGPNGAGKSSIVNGICLGLAGKPNVLGRSSSVVDFIRVGEDRATIEVELFHPEQDNVVIFRQIDRDGKSVWTINGKRSGLREVERAVAEFRIQVDNLCQFLPQDKVHDFSRLNSKGLLDSTVDAVGDISLKERHAKLKEMQKTMSEGEDLFERKQQILADSTEKFRKLEEEVKGFEEKKKIEEKISLAEVRLNWSKVNDVGKSWADVKSKYEAAQRKYEVEEQKMDPLKVEINNLKKKKKTLETKCQNLNASYKQSNGKAKVHSQNIEALEEQMDQAEEDIARVERLEEEKKEEIRRLKNALAEMEAECSSTQDDENLAPQCEEARRKTEDLLSAQSAKQAEINNLKYDHRNAIRFIEERREELKRLDDIDKMKLNKLKSLNTDAFHATLWLRQHRDQFQDDVQEPLIMCANVHDVQFSKYLENNIAARDMTAFFFADRSDMNRFLTAIRDQNGWKKVSAVTMPAGQFGNQPPNVPITSLKKFGFISYLKDLLSCPPRVMTYLCKEFGLHRIPVFKEEAEKSLKKLNEFGFNRVFIGNKVHEVQGSMYSSVKSTMSREVHPNKTLEITKDEERENYLSGEISAAENKVRDLEIKLNNEKEQFANINLELEAARKEQKSLEQRRHHKARMGAQIEAQRKILRQKMSDNVGSNRAKDDIIERKKSLVLQQVKSTQRMRLEIKELNNTKLKMELSRIAAEPLEQMTQTKIEELNEAKENIKGLKEDVSNLEGALQVAKEGLKDAMGDAHRATKELIGSREDLKTALRRSQERITGHGARKEEPPPELKELWNQEKIPSRYEEVDLLIAELRAQADCMETMDPRTVREYNNLRETIAELQQDIQRRQHSMEERMQTMQQLKQEWVTSLNNLVTRINTNFSSHFASMGFAGEVALSQGSHEDDFENYGIRIRVKYRDNEPLQELTAHHQSGGERSVATALYMLALQELTTVPFRCVDEINQGMDARNERLVFELLVRTSCHVSSAQYFLLTPKLLTGLQYSPRMNVLIVYNGPQMCHYTDWDMGSFTSMQA